MSDSGALARKKHFSIGETSQLVGLKEHVLRFWEKEFTQLKPRKSKSGRRIYTQEDLLVLQEIKRLLYEKKFTIPGARKELDKRYKHSSSATAPVKKNISTSTLNMKQRMEVIQELRDILKMIPD